MYHNLAEIQTGFDALSVAYPATCKLISLPHVTAEGRTVTGVRLGADGDRLAVLFVGGHHAREWVPPEVCLSLAADLLEAYDTGSGLSYAGVNYNAAQIQYIMETFHLYIVPVANPDGFVFSKIHDSIGGTQGWRRNRNPAQSGGNPSCIGVDLNRNYDILFDYQTHLSPSADQTHISTNPCNASQVYHGPAPNSEQETRNVIWMLDSFPKIRWFFDIHSYSELILYNWGWDELQSVDPTKNFGNAAYDGARGVEADSYSEYIAAGDLAIYQSLAEELRLGIQAVNGRNYAPSGSFGLYPTTGASPDYAYSRHLVNPAKAKVYGYTLEIGTEFRPPWPEAEDIIRETSSGLLRFLLNVACATWPLTLTPPAPLEIEFLDIPEGLTTFRAIVFAVRGCSPASIRMLPPGPQVTVGPPGTVFGTPAGLNSGPVSAAPNFETPAYARVWVSYTGTNAGDVAEGKVRVRCDETNQEWDILIKANTVARPSVAVMLALDQSGSMNAAAGTMGALRVEVLREAAARFVELIPQNNAVGIIRFDHDAYPVNDATWPGFPLTRIQTDAMADPDRIAARNAVLAHATNPNGYTSIGDGVLMARNTLNPAAGYDEKAIIVFTDGIENREETIAAVMGAIDNRTFAIGLGTETQVSTAGLMALAGVQDGYLLLTGHLTEGTDDYFRLTKYFHQILAGITRTEIVSDPSGHIAPGTKHRIPFVLTEADVEATVILLTDYPALRFWLEAPNGALLDPGVAAGLGITFNSGTNMRYYRFGLPLPLATFGAQAGLWHAVLEVDEKLYRRYLAGLENNPVRHSFARAHGIRYNVSVHSYSNLTMRARIDQDSLEPGALLNIRAALREYDLPVENRAWLSAEIEQPDKSKLLLELDETEAGIFEGGMVATMSGLYRILLRAEGRTRYYRPFTREHLMTAAVFRGGDGPPPFGGSDPGGRDEDFCALINCLLGSGSLREFLKRNNIDPDELRKCFDAWCARRRNRTVEGNPLAGSAGWLSRAPGAHGFTEAETRKLLLTLRDFLAAAQPGATQS